MEVFFVYNDDGFMKIKWKSKIKDEEGLRRTITRLAHEIIESNQGTENLAITGIRTRGVFVAKRISDKIKEMEDVEIPVGILDITMHRDDFRTKLRQPIVQATDIPFDITEKTIVLVDDVLYTGRTIRAALDALMDFGRPAAIWLAVLVDRGHRELPIKADFVGKNIPTSIGEEVRVKMNEIDDEDCIWLVEVFEE